MMGNDVSYVSFLLVIKADDVYKGKVKTAY